MRGTRTSAAVLLFLLCSVGIKVQSQERELNSIELLEFRLEISRHEQLQRIMAEYPDQLVDFTTDGCSGGLSVGWEYLASRVSQFRKIHGEIPPWQGCCVNHDWEYHSGATVTATAEESFLLRLEADSKLTECVRATGIDRVDELSEAYGITAEEVGGLYRFISLLMYRSVRIGGIPCSGLPWRWGYGWPECGKE